MSKKKKSIVIYEDWTVTIKDLPKDIKCEVVDALFTYGFTGNLPEDISQLAEAIIKPWCAVIDENNVKYQAKADNMAANRSKKSDRNQPEIKQKSDRNQSEIESVYVYVDDNVNVDVNDNVNDNVSPSEIIDILSICSNIINQYNTICISLPKVTKTTDARKKLVKARLKDYSVDELITVFEKAEASDFLSGRSKQWTSCNFDWLMKPTNIVKVIEGTYDNKGKATNGYVEAINNRYNVVDQWLERRAGND